MKIAINTAFALIFSTAVELLGGYDKILSFLVMLVIIDYFSGIIKAIKEKKLNSHIGFVGGLKKLGFFVAIAISHGLDSILPVDPVFRTITILFFISNEGMSVIENLGALGVPIPKALKDKFKNLKEDEDIDDNKSSIPEKPSEEVDKIRFK